MESADPAAISYFTAEVDNTIARAALLALLLSFLLLWLYRWAVQRSMRRTGPVRPYGAPQTETVNPAQAARVTLVNGEPGPAGGAAAAVARQALAGPWWNLLIYAAAGLVLATGMTAIYILVDGMPDSWRELLMLFLFNAWPIVLTIGLVKSLSWPVWIGIFVAFIAFATGITATEPGAEDWTDRMFEGRAAVANIGMSIYAFMVLLRPIRAIGPMVLLICLAFVVGMLPLGRIFDDPVMYATYMSVVSNWAGRLGMAPEWLSRIIVLGVLSAAIFTGWLLQRLIGALYARSIVSDQSLTIDALWLIAAVANGARFADKGYVWLAAAIGMFLIYKVVVLAGFSLRRRMLRTGAPPPSLLLLRVFARGRQRRTFFDAFSEPWRFAGPVRMIAGTDLASSTVEPHEFLDFVGGRLSRRFIAGDADLERRLAETTPARDHDGRFRVADFFCQDDTWKSVLRRLASDSDAVLMDLRGFGPANKGCIFEIEELLKILPLERIVFVVDQSTDRPFLEQALGTAMAALPESAENRRSGNVTVFGLNGRRDVRKLIGAVATAAFAQR